MLAHVFNYEERLRQAVEFFWSERKSPASEKRPTANADRRNNGAFTRESHLDAFRDMIVEVTRQYGPKGCEVLREENGTLLPGTLRQINPWDTVIIFQNRLLAAIELKSLCGPAFGIDADRLCEEVISSGYEFRKAQGAALFGQGASPFLGCFILVEDSPGSRDPVSAKSPHFPTDKIFHASSYQQRMKILCERMVEQQLYSCASVLVTSKESKSGDCSHLSNQTAFRFLLSRLASLKRSGFTYDHQNLIFQSAIFRLCASIEEYLKTFCEDLIYQFQAKSAKLSEVPANLKASSLLNRQMDIFKSYLFKGDEIATLKGLQPSAPIFKVCSDAELFTWQVGMRDIVGTKKYPSLKNLKVLYNRLGVTDIMQSAHKRGKKDYTSQLESFLSIREAISHQAPPPLTIGDVKRHFANIVELINQFDRIKYLHLSKISNSRFWPT